MSKRITENPIVSILKEASDVKHLKELEEENRRLKQIYADLSLEAQMQEEIIKKLESLLLSTKYGHKSYRHSMVSVLQLAVRSSV